MSNGIVLELQKEAMNHESNMLDVMSKAYVVANKLQLNDFQEWINAETKGYTSRSKIPTYRRVCSYLQYYNPYHGWQNVILSNKKEQEYYEQFSITDSIPSIVELLKRDNSFFYYPLPDKANIEYSEALGLGVPLTFAAATPRNAMANIVEQVRNTILNWSLLLEDKKIIGEGLSFSDDEKDHAKEKVITNYIVNIYGNASNTQIQQNTNSSAQNQ